MICFDVCGWRWWWKKSKYQTKKQQEKLKDKLGTIWWID